MPAAEAPPAPPPSVDAGGGQPPAASNAAAEGGGAGTTTVDTGQSTGTGAEPNSAGAEEKPEDAGGPSDAEKAAANAQKNLEASVRAEIVAENEGPEAALHDLADIKAHRPAPVISQAEADQRIQRAGEVREGVAEAPAASDAAPAAATDQEQPVASDAAASGETPLQRRQRQEQAENFLERASRQGGRKEITTEIKKQLREEAQARGETVNEKQLDQQATDLFYRQKAEAGILTKDKNVLGVITENRIDFDRFQASKADALNAIVQKAMKEHGHIDEQTYKMAELEAQITALARFLQERDKRKPGVTGLLFVLAVILKTVIFDNLIEPAMMGKQQR